METTMYDDARSRLGGGPLTVTIRGETGGVKALKRSMTLDLNSSSSGKSSSSAKRSKFSNITGSVLASPDLNMLKLASPELERMIIQQNGMVTTTPTPTQFICPKFVTEEQEAYARGFVDALEELHRKEPGTKTVPASENSKDTRTLAVLQPALANRSLPGISNITRTAVSSQDFYLSASAQVSLPVNGYQSYSIPHSTIPQTTNAAQSRTQYSSVGASNLIGSNLLSNPLLSHIKEEPQTVPATPPPPPLSVSPINMEYQEVHKSERKRARNRIAARKCRHRKLERISRLEEKVAQLKGQNSELSSTASKLRDQVCALKQQILDHVKNGCQVLMSQNLTF